MSLHINTIRWIPKSVNMSTGRYTHDVPHKVYTLLIKEKLKNLISNSIVHSHRTFLKPITALVVNINMKCFCSKIFI